MDSDGNFECGKSCDRSTEVSFGGECYSLDGTHGVCQGFDVVAPQSVLADIAISFVGKDYKTQISGNCCIEHADQGEEGQDWGFDNSQCNDPGPFAVPPTLGGSGCTDSNNSNATQLTLCQSQTPLF